MRQTCCVGYWGVESDGVPLLVIFRCNEIEWKGREAMPLGDGSDLNIPTTDHFALHRCPHCSTANPTIFRQTKINVTPKKPPFSLPAGQLLQWSVYCCESCGGLVAAASQVSITAINMPLTTPAKWIVPSIQSLSSDIPASASRYLAQARETLSSPAASVVMSASAVDAMLKERGYKDGSLYSRLKKAEEQGLLTKDMAAWAHDVRVDANDERHADLDASGATASDASRCLDFASTLADLLFVLPARVKRGLTSATTASPHHSP
jgi:hypothetical protein